MLEEFFERAVISVLIFWGGLNFIGFGMILNGFDASWNPVWQPFALLFYVEFLILEILFFSCLGIAVLAIFWQLLCFFKTEILGDTNIEPRKEKHFSDIEETETLPFTDINIPTAIPKPTEPITITHVLEAPLKREPTPEERRREAIKQIIRG